MQANDSRRYIVRMEVFAAAGPVDLDAEDTGEAQPGLEEICKDLAKADPDEIEDQTYRALRFDLCNTCRRALLASPLGRDHTGQ